MYRRIPRVVGLVGRLTARHAIRLRRSSPGTSGETHDKTHDNGVAGKWQFDALLGGVPLAGKVLCFGVAVAGAALIVGTFPTLSHLRPASVSASPPPTGGGAVAEPDLLLGLVHLNERKIP